MPNWIIHTLLLNSISFIFSFVAAKIDAQLSKRLHQSNIGTTAHKMLRTLIGLVWSLGVILFIMLAGILNDLNSLVFIVSLVVMPFIMLLMKLMTHNPRVNRLENK